MNEEVKENNIEASKESKKAKKVNEEIELLKKSNQELSEKSLRLIAEMQNMQRRFEQEKADIYKYEGENLVKKMLPILDNFERAISLDDDNLKDDLSKFLTGFKMIYSSLIAILKEMGVEEIDALGKQFDPNKMEAILTANIAEEEQNVVVEVLQKGYTYNGKVIRVAMVKVNE